MTRTKEKKRRRKGGTNFSFWSRDWMVERRFSCELASLYLRRGRSVRPSVRPFLRPSVRDAIVHFDQIYSIRQSCHYAMITSDGWLHFVGLMSYRRNDGSARTSITATGTGALIWRWRCQLFPVSFISGSSADVSDSLWQPEFLQFLCSPTDDIKIWRKYKENENVKGTGQDIFRQERQRAKTLLRSPVGLKRVFFTFFTISKRIFF